MWYKIERVNKQFIISNVGESSIYASLYLSPTGDREEDYEIVNSEVCILKGEDSSFTLPSNEGLFKLILTNKAGKTEEIFIPQYEVLLTSLIEDVDNILCGCECADCPDCDGENEDVLSVVLKLLAFNTLNRDKYANNLASTSRCVECDILDISKCNLLQENVIGNINNTALLKKLVAYYYLVFYYTDLYLSRDETATKSIYNFSKIFPCVKKYNLDINCISLNSISTNIIESHSSGVDNEAILSMELKFKALEEKFSLLKVNFDNLQNTGNNFQPKLTRVFDINHIVNSTDALPSSSIANWGDIALWKGVLYKFIQKNSTSGEWIKLSIDGIIYNGQPREDYVYRLNNEYYLYNSNIQRLIQISKYSGTGIVTPPIDTTPAWVDTGQTGWSSSNVTFLPLYTGEYEFKEQRDMNPNSSTYNQTRWISTGNTQGGTFSTGLVYYGDSGTSPENFNNMSIEAIFNTTENTRKLLTVTGKINNNFTVGMDGQIHYLLVPRDSVELVRAEFGSELISVLWDNLSMSGDYKTSNPGGMWQGKYYNVYFLYVPGGAVISDIRLTLKNK